MKYVEYKLHNSFTLNVKNNLVAISKLGIKILKYHRETEASKEKVKLDED